MSDFAQLTFVSRLDDGRLDLWTPERPEGWAAGCAMGHDYAAELVTFMRMTGSTAVFGAVMRAITRSGVHEAVETGFCQHFSVILLGVPVTVPVATVQPVRDAV